MIIIFWVPLAVPARECTQEATCSEIMYICMYGHTYSKSIDQLSTFANPARGQLNRESCPRSRLIIWSRETGSVVPSRVSLLISILRLNLVFTYGIPPEFHGGVHLLI